MTTIEWTDKTWNPTTGCDQVSPACDGGRTPKAGGRTLDGRTWDEYPTLHPHASGVGV